MQLRDATDMLADSGVKAHGGDDVADLGSSDGMFILALAGLLASGSTVHAMDLDRAALRAIPSGIRRGTNHCASRRFHEPAVAIRRSGRHSDGQLAALRREPGGVHSRIRIADETATIFPDRGVRHYGREPMAR